MTCDRCGKPLQKGSDYHVDSQSMPEEVCTRMWSHTCQSSTGNDEVAFKFEVLSCTASCRRKAEKKKP